jgi:hypothetical protein
MLSRNSAGQTKKSITYAVTCTSMPYAVIVVVLRLMSMPRHRLGRRERNCAANLPVGLGAPIPPIPRDPSSAV